MQDRFFVDKSMLIGELIPALGRKNRYLCITRPRRFGKTVMASMIGAFFEKNSESENLFERLEISQDKDGFMYRNRYDVIYIDFSRLPYGRNNTPYPNTAAFNIRMTREARHSLLIVIFYQK